MTAALFAIRTGQHPAIVQVNEIATATMMAAKGATYSVHQLMREQGATFDPQAYLPPYRAITPTPAAIRCRFRSTPRRRSFTTTRISSAWPSSMPRRRRARGLRWRLPQKSSSRRACHAVSPRRGRHGSMSRACPLCTMSRSPPSSTGSADSIPSCSFRTTLSSGT